MKRYVKEFASDEINTFRKLEKQYGHDYSVIIARIENTVKNCERGMITSFEAVKCISETITA